MQTMMRAVSHDAEWNSLLTRRLRRQDAALYRRRDARRYVVAIS